MKAKLFKPDDLLPVLKPYLGKKWYLAFSGGVDSIVLFHCLVNLKARDLLGKTRFEAIHVNHQLHPDAEKWAQHCVELCKKYDFPIKVMGAHVVKYKDESLEETARRIRYQCFQHAMTANSCLLTAHHQTDQVETLLQRLIKGGGIAGLSAMRTRREFHRSILLRPLLNFSRSRLEDYANSEGLVWHDDPSNEDPQFDRNYIRQNVLPVIARRWPRFEMTIGRSAEIQQESLQLLNELAQQDLVKTAGPQSCTLDLNLFNVLSEARQRNALRFWLQKLSEQANLPALMPSQAQLKQLQKDLLQSRGDASPLFLHKQYMVRRYRHLLYWALVTPIAAPERLPFQLSDLLDQGLVLSNKQQISADLVCGQGLDLFKLGEPLTIRPRIGGERFHPKGRQGSHPLKKLYQEAGIPPWERGLIPLLYCGEDLVAVVGLGWYASDYVCTETAQEGLILSAGP